ncbi:MAG: hypothetical protein HFH08_07085 [Bacilli bacterium]|nr:hypothetical protein [Bacilli bacterium]
MSEERIQNILNATARKLQSLGFLIENIKNKNFYTISRNIYYYLSYVNELDSFVIEAGTKEEAEKNVLVDIALFPMSIGIQTIEDEILKWFIEYCIDKQEQNIL